MTYTLWDKKTAVNGVEAVDIIGAEQMANDDPFILFMDASGTVVAIESMATIKGAYGLTGDTWDIVAAAYVAYIAAQAAAPAPLTIDELAATVNDALVAVMQLSLE